MRTYHTSWTNVLLNFLQKNGFDFVSYPEQGTDIFTKKVNGHVIKVEDMGGCPIISVDSVDVYLNTYSGYSSAYTKRKVINLLKSILNNPKKYTETVTFYWVHSDYFEHEISNNKSKMYFDYNKHLLPSVTFKASALELLDTAEYEENYDAIDDYFTNYLKYKVNGKGELFLSKHPVFKDIVKHVNVRK